MSKTDKISDYKTKKTRKVSFVLNDDMWELFKKGCEQDTTKPTWQFEKWILSYLDEKGMLED